MTLVRATLKCVEDEKSFLLERDAPQLLTRLYEIEKGLCEMSTSSLRQKSIRDFLIVVIKCMLSHVLSSLNKNQFRFQIVQTFMYEVAFKNTTPIATNRML